MRLLAALLLVGCAHAVPPAPTPETSIEACAAVITPDAARWLAAQILSEACTSQATDEVLIQHAKLMLDGCVAGQSVGACLRRVCMRISELDDSPSVAH